MASLYMGKINQISFKINIYKTCKCFFIAVRKENDETINYIIARDWVNV